MLKGEGGVGGGGGRRGGEGGCTEGCFEQCIANGVHAREKQQLLLLLLLLLPSTDTQSAHLHASTRCTHMPVLTWLRNVVSMKS